MLDSVCRKPFDDGLHEPSLPTKQPFSVPPVAPQVPVQMVRLQDWCAQHSLSYIDVLKTDCQGYDLEVLKGADALLRNRQIGTLCVEVLFTELYQGQAYFDDILSFLRLRGYSLFGIYGVCRDSERAMAWADAVFMAPKPPR